MKAFQNSNVVFRCPTSLKERMKAFAEANNQHLSSFIRSACVEVLRREAPICPTSADIEARLREIVL